MTIERPATRRPVLVPIVGVAAATAVVAALADFAPDPVPHLPFWLLVGMFGLAGLDGYLDGDDRQGLSPPSSRVALLIGLVFDLPLHLLGAQALGMALVALLPDGRTSQDKLLEVAGSLAATSVGIVAFVALSDTVPATGRDVWLDAGVAGLVVVAVSHGVDAARRWSAHPGLRAAVAGRARTVGRDLTAVAIGLVVVEVLRADLAAGWLLALPTGAVLLARRRLADSAARGASLLQLGEAEVQLRATVDTRGAAQITAQRLAAITSAARVRVSVTLPSAPTVTVEVAPGFLTERSWTVPPAHAGDEVATRRPGIVESLTDRRRERTVVPVTAGDRRLGTIEVVDRPASSRIRRVHREAINLLAGALGQQLQLIERWEELRALSAQDRQLADRLQASNEDLEQLSSARSVFLATTSHELRAPLSALLVEAQVLDQLARAGALDGDVRRLIDGVGENTRHLLRMVDDLLALARLEADLLEVARLPLDLVEVVTTVADTCRPMLEAAGIELTVLTPPSAPILGDRDRVWQVLANLVDNAARVMPDGGAIELAISRDADGTRLSVTDTGPGIDADELERLFAPFERGAVRGPGLGLGLAIARALMVRHGGHLLAEGRAGTGMTFSAVFPRPSRAMPSELGARQRPSTADTAPGPDVLPGSVQPDPV